MLLQMKMQINANPLLHQAKYYLSYRLKNFASGKKSLEREARKLLSLRFKEVLSLSAEGNGRI